MTATFRATRLEPRGAAQEDALRERGDAAGAQVDERVLGLGVHLRPGARDPPAAEDVVVHAGLG